MLIDSAFDIWYSINVKERIVTPREALPESVGMQARSFLCVKGESYVFIYEKEENC